MPSKFPMPPGPPSREPQMKVDLTQATDVACDNCGNYTFTEVVLMKHLSALASPTSQPIHVPFPTFACNACGFVNEAFLPPPMRKGGAPKEESSEPKPNVKFDVMGRTVTESPTPNVTTIELSK